jgi:hypothetical protein
MTVKKYDENVKLGTKMREYYVVVFQIDGKDKIVVEEYKYKESNISRYCKNVYGENKRYGPFYQENWAVQKAMELEEGK